MTISVALGADLFKQSHERTYGSSEEIGCSCDAPGVVGKVCATADRCEEMSGLCVGRCTYAAKDLIGCSCDAPGVVGKVCATADRCEEMSGLCVGPC
jgi:hypothetical protein